MLSYAIILGCLLVAELLYFKIADKFNIIDKPNERSSHSTVILRGGGIVFLVGVWLWCAFSGFQYPWFVLAVTLAAGISFVDDIRSLPDSVRLSVQFVAMGLMIWQLCVSGGGAGTGSDWLMKVLFALVALVICVGATNIYNFMDGINGITAGYSLVVVVPLWIMNRRLCFIEDSYLVVTALSLLVFGFFNFRNKGKAKCFAGDVGSVGMAFILLFATGMLIVKAGDVTWLIFLLVYGMDGCMTICHRILLHENLGQAHRKHAYQIMANELKMSHPLVSFIYMLLQTAVSMGFIFLCPVVSQAAGISPVLCHWLYLALAMLALATAYLLFMKKYYHLHEEYLAGLEVKK